MHELFAQLIQAYQIKPELVKLLKLAIVELINGLEATSSASSKPLKDNLAALKKKLEVLEERFVIGDLEKDLYLRYSSRYKDEIRELEQEISSTEVNLSNLDHLLDKSLSIASEMPFLWQKADFRTRQNLQKTLFPTGITYDKVLGHYRTPKVNAIFELSRLLSGTIGQEKSGRHSSDEVHSASVEREGFEPPDL